jgi:hypothetical protein
LLVLLDILTVFGAYKVYKEELKLNDWTHACNIFIDSLKDWIALILISLHVLILWRLKRAIFIYW